MSSDENGRERLWEMGDAAVGVVMFTFPKNRSRGSVAVTSNLFVQFWISTRHDSITLPLRRNTRTHFDFWMIWRNSISNQPMWCPQTVIHVYVYGSIAWT